VRYISAASWSSEVRETSCSALDAIRGSGAALRRLRALYHAATKAVRKAFREACAIFVAAFREAADRLKAGDRQARFRWARLRSSSKAVAAAAGRCVGCRRER
jgi:hypothetical protein